MTHKYIIIFHIIVPNKKVVYFFCPYISKITKVSCIYNDKMLQYSWYWFFFLDQWVQSQWEGEKEKNPEMLLQNKLTLSNSSGFAIIY